MVHEDKMRALGQMASGVAHDINQSLGIIAGHADIARSGLLPEYPVNEDLRIIGQAAVDGGETVNRLLRSAVSDKEPVNVGELLGEVARLTAPRWRDQSQLEGRPISLHVGTDTGLVIDGQPALSSYLALVSLDVSGGASPPGRLCLRDALRPE